MAGESPGFKSFFFFQAEDGIRDLTVTGVQTCALPICAARRSGTRPAAACGSPRRSWPRSEERRVGKSVDLGGRRIIKKKKTEIRAGTARPTRCDRKHPGKPHAPSPPT